MQRIILIVLHLLSLKNSCTVERLREVFRKNGIDYRLLDRTSKVALFEQKLPSGELAGYEVCKICFN